MIEEAIAPVRRAVTVYQRREVLFDVLVEEFGEWWPIHVHSLGHDDVKIAVLEPHVGGRCTSAGTTGPDGKAPTGPTAPVLRSARS